MSGFVSWVPEFVSWVPGFVSWVSGLVSCVSGLVSWVSGIVSWVPGIVSWVPGIVSWLSDHIRVRALADYNLHFFDLLGSGRVNSGRKWVNKDLLSSCRLLLAEIRDFSRHPKSANPEFLVFGSKLTHFHCSPP